jgi:hypothetical protein
MLPNEGIIMEFAWRDRGKSQEALARSANILVKITPSTSSI